MDTRLRTMDTRPRTLRTRRFTMDPRRTLLACLLLSTACLGVADDKPVTVTPPAKPEARIAIAPKLGGESSALIVKTSLLPESSLELLTCEALLDGDKDLGMFLVKLGEQDWKREGEGWSYEFDLPPGVRLRFAAQPEKDSLKLEYTLTNQSKETLERAHLHPCLPTVGAFTFYPGSQAEAATGSGGRAARAGRKDFAELYERLFLWSKNEKYSFGSTEKGHSEVHLAFMAKNEAPIEWNWWKNGEKTFDVPLIALESKDKQHVLALGFEEATWASSNVGDSRACMHLFPSFGRLAPGKSATVKGRLYLMEGKAEDALKRFRKDFGG